MILSLYRTVTTIGWPLIRLYLNRRMANGKEDAKRFGERLGRAGIPRPDGPLVWIHGASVGESLSMLPLIERLRKDKPTWNVLVTTGTISSAALMKERLPEKAMHQYVPVDRYDHVRCFLDHWRPNLVLWAESEFWPNLVSVPAQRKIPMILINGRISANSLRGWRRFPGFIRTLLSGFDLCLGQSAADAERLKSLGAKTARCVGNLKFAALPLPADTQAIEALGKIFAGRPLWLAASTHAGEEQIIGTAHDRLKKQHPGLLSIIVPRHPGRGRDIADKLISLGLSVALRSSKQPVTADTDIYIADTIGELGLFYRLSPIVFIGKSLVPLGGQNPLEAARLECAIITGPYMANFDEISAKLITAGASLQVTDKNSLADAVGRLLSDDAARGQLARAALGVATAEAGVLDAVMSEIEPYMTKVSDHEGA